MEQFEITHIKTDAEPETWEIGSKILQYALVEIKFPKGFNFEAGGASVLRKLRAAVELVGKPEKKAKEGEEV